MPGPMRPVDSGHESFNLMDILLGKRNFSRDGDILRIAMAGNRRHGSQKGLQRRNESSAERCHGKEGPVGQDNVNEVADFRDNSYAGGEIPSRQYLEGGD